MKNSKLSTNVLALYTHGRAGWLWKWTEMCVQRVRWKRWWILMKRESVTKDVARRKVEFSSTLYSHWSVSSSFDVISRYILCRIALRLWIIDFYSLSPSQCSSLERKESNERLEQPFFRRFSRYFNHPPLRSRLFARYFACVGHRADGKAILGREGGEQWTHVYIHIFSCYS